MTPSPIRRGYIALISVLAISFAMMTIALLASENGLRARMNTSAFEDRIMAAHRARSCAFIALLYKAQEGSYRPEYEIVWLTEKHRCVIEGVLGTDEHMTIETNARVGKSISHVHMEAVFALTPAITITGWLEP